MSDAPRFRAEYWEEGEYIITMAGTVPIGMTLPERPAYTVVRRLDDWGGVAATEAAAVRDRDALWCRAVVAMLDPCQAERLFACFSAHRPDGQPAMHAAADPVGAALALATATDRPERTTGARGPPREAEGQSR